MHFYFGHAPVCLTPPHLGIHVGPVQVDLSVVLLVYEVTHDVADVLWRYFSQSLAGASHFPLETRSTGRLARVTCESKAWSVKPHQGFEVGQVDVPILVHLHHLDLHASHLGAGWVGAVGRLWDQADLGSR